MDINKKEGFVEVEIPEFDIYDYPHPGVGLNFNHYGPGKHKVTREIAEAIQERLDVFEKMNIRIMQPRKDSKAVRDAKSKSTVRSEETE